MADPSPGGLILNPRRVSMNQEKSQQPQSLELLEAEIEQVSGGAIGEIQRQYQQSLTDDNTKAAAR
jgi:hypothetical protein